MRRSTLIYSALVAIFIVFIYFRNAGEALVIHHDNTLHRYQIELAETLAEQKKGLMNRKDLPVGHGMLFVWGYEKHIDMWMKNTYMPLDMLFINRQGIIVHIVTDTTPLSEELIPSEQPAYAVLELPAGTVRRDGITVGDRAEYKTFAP